MRRAGNSAAMSTFVAITHNHYITHDRRNIALSKQPLVVGFNSINC